MSFHIQFQFRVFNYSLKSRNKSKMKAISILALLFAATQAARLPIPLRVYENAYNNSRIVGGEEAVAGEGAFSAYLTINNWLCGGIIYNERTIITASHCLEG